MSAAVALTPLSAYDELAAVRAPNAAILCGGGPHETAASIDAARLELLAELHLPTFKKPRLAMSIMFYLGVRRSDAF